MFDWLFTKPGGATAVRAENLMKAPNAAKPPNSKNSVVTVGPADPNATKLKVVPHPTASAPTPQGQQGGRRKTKGKRRKGKGKKRSTRK